MVDWPGLLKWSTNYHDGTAPSNFKPLSQEDRGFLEAAMEHAFAQVEDPNKILQEAIKEVKSPERTNASLITALELMDKCCDDVDCARNVEKFDGIRACLDLLDWPNDIIKVRTLEILALFLSNNRDIQEAAEKHGCMAIFLRLVRESSSGNDVKLKAFRAASALMRGVPALEKKFLDEEGGTSILVNCMSLADDERLREKASSLVALLVSAEGGSSISAEGVAQLSIALGPLIATAGGAMQYRETIARCVLDLSSAPGAAKEYLLGAIQQRLKDGGAEQDEKDLLVQCAVSLKKSSNPSVAPAA